jgi:hypothetical protein
MDYISSAYCQAYVDSYCYVLLDQALIHSEELPGMSDRGSRFLSRVAERR